MATREAEELRRKNASKAHELLILAGLKAKYES
jgi:hypothetical protein